MTIMILVISWTCSLALTVYVWHLRRTVADLRDWRDKIQATEETRRLYRAQTIDKLTATGNHFVNIPPPAHRPTAWFDDVLERFDRNVKARQPDSELASQTHMEEKRWVIAVGVAGLVLTFVVVPVLKELAR